MSNKIKVLLASMGLWASGLSAGGQATPAGGGPRAELFEDSRRAIHEQTDRLESNTAFDKTMASSRAKRFVAGQSVRNLAITDGSASSGLDVNVGGLTVSPGATIRANSIVIAPGKVGDVTAVQSGFRK